MSRALPSVAVVLAMVLGASLARAQQPAVRMDQRLREQVPITASFADETGRNVVLGEFIVQRPTVLVLPFYTCRGVCTAELEGMTRTFKEMGMTPGQEFETVVVSINPAEKPALAAEKKAQYVGMLGKPAAAAGWHFLTGEEAQIRRVADSIGFRYEYDTVNKTYRHPAGLVVLTPGGRVSRYFFGVNYSPRDLRLALVEASAGKIGSVVDQIILTCSAFDFILSSGL